MLFEVHWLTLVPCALLVGVGLCLLGMWLYTFFAIVSGRFVRVQLRVASVETRVSAGFIPVCRPVFKCESLGESFEWVLDAFSCLIDWCQDSIHTGYRRIGTSDDLLLARFWHTAGLIGLLFLGLAFVLFWFG